MECDLLFSYTMTCIGWLCFLGAASGMIVPTSLAQTSSVPATVRYEFREPRLTGYWVERPPAQPVVVKSSVPSAWLKAWPDGSSTNYVKFGSRIVLELKAAADLRRIIQDQPVQLSRTVNDRVFILAVPDAWTAVKVAAALAEDSRVAACYPIALRPKQFYRNYANKPNDPYFAKADNPDLPGQPYLENRDTNGTPLGIDLNVRAAWAVTRGEGITLAVADDGMELAHPDLVSQTQGAPHFNFYSNETNGLPSGPLANHATAVAGLVAASGNNRAGISGVAPAVRLASWVIFSSSDRLEVSDETLLDVFQYKSNVVSIQNHSWGKDGNQQIRLTTLENIGIANATTFGRAGRGIVMVRAGGNGRTQFYNANDDGYLADPRVIPVAAARLDGRVTRYSSPGACILVAALSGDEDPVSNPCIPDSPNLLTTDRQGMIGYNRNSYTNDFADYAYGTDGFSGTSAATPQISGVAALMLAANAKLTYRDVQQILLHSARHSDLADPDVTTNAAGFRVSHNLGFGIPDAGLAVTLARIWTNRPPSAKIVYTATNAAAIPDQGLRLLVRGKNVPTNLVSLVGLPGLGAFPDKPTASLPAVDVGTTTNGISVNLTGHAAFIQRGGNFFCEKLSMAATAGAEFAIVSNNRDGDVRLIMGATDFSTIPSILISQNDGEALRDYLATDATARVQLALQTTNYTFVVKESFLCEHVGVRIDSNHTRRGDLRITLISPKGTRSVLQSLNSDDAGGPVDWTYYSTHHFYESSAGTWTVEFSDLDVKGTGSVKSANLIITGVPIVDTDLDGLDDSWELRNFETLASRPLDDPDSDGFINSREQIMGTNPRVVDFPFHLDLSLWDEQLARLSWPSSTNTIYQIKVGNQAGTLLNLVTNLPGRFPETEIFIPYANLIHQFFRVEAIPIVPPGR
jgi:subtilisin-like proprotein convertase family protein/subtilisin family serine protease